MTLTYREYQHKASATSVYPDHIGWLYLTTKLAGEVGELLNLVGKVMRGDFVMTDAKPHIIEELGGILWYIAEWHTYTNERMYSADSVMTNGTTRSHSDPVHSIVWASRQMLIPASAILQINEGDNTKVRNLLADIIWYIQYICDVLGVELHEVAQANLDKLAKRAEKGTIKGHNRGEE